MKRCPYCGGEIKPGAAECPHCERKFGEKKEDSQKASLSSMDAYQRTIPAWVFYVVVALALIGLLLVFF